jgi:hypothetical protein
VFEWDDVTSVRVRRAAQLLASATDAVVGDGDIPCGLLVGDDPHPGYDGEPGQFFAFARMGVDGVHYGLWVDSPDQEHEPCVVMLSPMDFSQQIVALAPSARDWIESRRIPGQGSTNRDVYERAVDRGRERLGLLPLPKTFEDLA